MADTAETPERTNLINDIVSREWDFFQKTQNVGGRAGCQDQPVTFGIMRRSQFRCWSTDTLTQYRSDLEADKEVGFNPVTGKYAYMMQWTHPDEFERIQDLLPSVSDEQKKLAEEIIAVNLPWEEECSRLYPNVRSGGRPIHSTEDNACTTSFETYLRGELYTYSEETLKLLARDIKKAKEEGRNLAQANLNFEAQEYGFASAEALEKRASAMMAEASKTKNN